MYKVFVRLCSKSSAASIAAAAVMLASGCGGTGGSEGSGDKYAETAEGYYLRGYEFGAQDAQAGRPADLAQYTDRIDTTFTVQFESGYRQAYALYRR